MFGMYFNTEYNKSKIAHKNGNYRLRRQRSFVTVQHEICIWCIMPFSSFGMVDGEFSKWLTRRVLCNFVGDVRTFVRITEEENPLASSAVISYLALLSPTLCSILLSDLNCLMVLKSQ